MTALTRNPHSDKLSDYSLSNVDENNISHRSYSSKSEIEDCEDLFETQILYPYKGKMCVAEIKAASPEDADKRLNSIKNGGFVYSVSCGENGGCLPTNMLIEKFKEFGIETTNQ